MNNLQTVPFHNHNIFLIDKDGEPFTPMKPIVQGMGLAWQPQAAKFKANAKRWGITMIVTPAKSGDQSMLCLPLKKLFGWMMTIQPSRVKESVRETVINYQDECDNVLWNYWLKKHSQSTTPELPSTITPAQKGTLLAIMDARCADVPAMRQGSVRARMWRVVNRHNGVNSYHETPATAFEDTKAMLETMDIKLGEVVEQKAIKDEPTVSMAGKIPVSESTLIAYKRASRKVADAYKQVESIEQELHLARHHFDKAVTGMRNFRKASWDVVNDAAFLAKIL